MRRRAGQPLPLGFAPLEAVERVPLILNQTHSPFQQYPHWKLQVEVSLLEEGLSEEQYFVKVILKVARTDWTMLVWEHPLQAPSPLVADSSWSLRLYLPFGVDECGCEVR